MVSTPFEKDQVMLSQVPDVTSSAETAGNIPHTRQRTISRATIRFYILDSSFIIIGYPNKRVTYNKGNVKEETAC